MATFITSKSVGEFININVETTTGYWKYNHNGNDYGPFNQGDGGQSVEVLNLNGEFILISWDNDLEQEGGDITILDLQGDQLTSFDGTGLSVLTFLELSNNQLTSLDVSPMTSLLQLSLNGKEGGNPLTASANDSILAQLVVNGLTNGVFHTIGGRTSAGTANYDILFNYRAWDIQGADLVIWYRFKALGTQWTDVVSGFPNNIIKEVGGSGRTTYPSNGYSYFDFLTDDVVGTITFGDGNGGTIEATPVPVTLQEFSSSGSFTAGVGFGGAAIGYANTTALGSWGTLNSGTLPAIPSRYEGIIPAGSIIFSDIFQPVTPEDLMLITAPILLQFSINDNPIDLTGIYGKENGTSFNPFGFVDGETYTFSMTWGELIEMVQRRKLRVKGVGQLNP